MKNSIQRSSKYLNKPALCRKEIVNFNSAELLQWVVKWQLMEAVSNVVLALRLYFTVCVSVVSCERSFSKLKLIRRISNLQWPIHIFESGTFVDRKSVDNGD